MGLDARVYKNLRDIPENLREQITLDDTNTGELNYKDSPDGPWLSRRDLYAVKLRIGNIAMVDWLRDEVEKLLPEESLMLNAVLYSGSHSGDFIPLGQLDELAREVKVLEAGPATSPPYLQQFLEKMNALIEAARKEQNPIVF